MSIPPYLLRKLRKKQRLLLRRLILVVIVIVALAIWLWPKYSPVTAPGAAWSQPDSQQATETGAFNRSMPSFDVLTPAGKSLDELDGWTVTPPTEGSSYFAYVDTVDSVQLQVSQQELPPSFASDTQKQIETLASSFNADRTVTTPDNTTVYIGTSASGPQSVIAVKRGLLILIKSSTALDDEQWSKYIELLE